MLKISCHSKNWLSDTYKEIPGPTKNHELLRHHMRIYKNQIPGPLHHVPIKKSYKASYENSENHEMLRHHMRIYKSQIPGSLHHVPSKKSYKASYENSENISFKSAVLQGTAIPRIFAVLIRDICHVFFYVTWLIHSFLQEPYCWPILNQILRPPLPAPKCF